jgi:hypothetical protein
MIIKHRSRGPGGWKIGLVAGLLFAVLIGPAHGQNKPERATGEGHLGQTGRRPYITVHQGQLSVDLWEVEVGDVLTRIGHEAGVLITGSPTTGARVSAQFMDVELEAGLRRLLGRAALSYAIRYARDSTGAVAMQEVRVFGAVSEEPLSPLNATARTGPDRTVRSRAGPQPPAD